MDIRSHTSVLYFVNKFDEKKTDKIVKNPVRPDLKTDEEERK